MFVAHLAGGYLLSRSLVSRDKYLPFNKKQKLQLVLTGCLFSILPDFDLIYFYLIDGRQHHHHSYWTHMPVFWLLLSGILYLLAKRLYNQQGTLVCILLFVNTWVHMLLDSVAGGIYWFYPWSDAYYRFFNITARYDWWVLNYILHWTFLIEFMIVLTAICVFYRTQYRSLVMMTVRDKLGWRRESGL